MIDAGVGGRLLGRHVGRRAERDAGGGELLPSGGFADGLGHTEVGHQRMAAGEEHVVGLDVAVHDAAPVRVRQGVGHLDQDLHRVVDRQLALPGNPGAERLALDVGHDVPEEPPGFTRVMQRQDVGVLKLGRELDLTQEPLGAERDGELGAEHLESDEPLVPEVPCEVHRGHAALPELALNGIAVCQGRGQGWGVGGHGLWVEGPRIH